MARTYPNVAITGTPGVGKSKIARRLVEVLPNHDLIDINVEAQNGNLYEARDVEREAWIIDTGKLEDEFSEKLYEGGCILDWMHADFWDPRLIDLVITLRANNTILYDRYAMRNYPNAKIQENLDSEIMNEIGMANLEYFDDDHTSQTEALEEVSTNVVELRSETEEDFVFAVDSTRLWCQQWTAMNGGKEESQWQKVPFTARRSTNGELTEAS